MKPSTRSATAIIATAANGTTGRSMGIATTTARATIANVTNTAYQVRTGGNLQDLHNPPSYLYR